MKNWIANCRRLIHDKKGETLVEATVSILVFAILMLTVSLVVLTASNMNQYELQKSKDAQTVINRATLETPDSAATIKPASIIFKSNDLAEAPVEVTQKIEVVTDKDLVWFKPLD